MARIRTIKPEFWTDSKTGTLSDKATKLFIGLLNYCDDYGVIKFDVAEFSAKIFPFENFLEHSRILASVLDKEILAKGLAIVFSIPPDDQDISEDGEEESYLWIRNFEKHQKVDKPGKPLLKEWKSGDNPRSYCQRLGYGYANKNHDSESVRENSRTLEKIRLGKEGNSKGKEKDMEVLRTSCSEPKNGSEPYASKSVEKDKPDLIIASPQPSSPIVCEIPIIGPKSTYPITQAMIDDWQDTFPGIDVLHEVKSCRAWNIANPTRQKTGKGIARHIVSWLQRAQDKGGSKPNQAQTRGHPDRPPHQIIGQTKTFVSNAIAISQAIQEIQKGE